MNDQLQGIYTCESILLGYKCLDSKIRQKYVRLEADRFQNGRASRDNYRNSKGEI